MSCPDPVSVITVDTVVPLLQDEATEGTMSSEALPLIFEPLEEVTSEEAAAESAVTPQPDGARPAPTGSLSESDGKQLDAGEANSDSASHAVPDWTTPWQASGTKVLETVSSLGPSVAPPQVGVEPEHPPDRGERPDVAIHEPKCQHNTEHHQNLTKSLLCHTEGTQHVSSKSVQSSVSYMGMDIFLCF